MGMKQKKIQKKSKKNPKERLKRTELGQKQPKTQKMHFLPVFELKLDSL